MAAYNNKLVAYRLLIPTIDARLPPTYVVYVVLRLYVHCLTHLSTASRQVSTRVPLQICMPHISRINHLQPNKLVSPAFPSNNPLFLAFTRRIIRPMLNERTQAKIGIINADKTKIAAALLECIPSENLPKQYGGTCPLDLGESEEEQDLRAYVASITPSLSTGDAIREEEQVEVDIGNNLFVPSSGFLAKGEGEANGSRRKPGLYGTGNDSTVVQPELGNGEDGRMVQGESGSTFSGGGGGDGNMPPPRRSAAQRVLGRVGGALGWAGGKLAWRHSPAPAVAHLGEENAFVYDADLQQWVLKGEAGKNRGGARGQMEGSGADSSTGQMKTSRAAYGREDSMGSNTSEEMTVLAIQVRTAVRLRYVFLIRGSCRVGSVCFFSLSSPGLRYEAADAWKYCMYCCRPKSASVKRPSRHGITAEGSEDLVGLLATW